MDKSGSRLDGENCWIPPQEITDHIIQHGKIVDYKIPIIDGSDMPKEMLYDLLEDNGEPTDIIRTRIGLRGKKIYELTSERYLQMWADYEVPKIEA